MYEFSVIEKLVGVGPRRLLTDNKVAGTTEMDFMDLLKMLGLLGFLLIYVSFLCLNYFLLKMYLRLKIVEFKMVIVLNIFFAVASAMSGHLFTSGSATIFLAILNIYPFLVRENSVKEKYHNVI